MKLKKPNHSSVYATKEERVRGGGCLELTKNVASVLSLNENEITGIWDFSHNMQLVWSDTIKNKPWITELIKNYFSTMSDLNTGKASTQFQEKAKELGNSKILDIDQKIL